MPDDVSLATVAERAGVSISTVSRIVNGETRRASAETVKRVKDAIEAVGYRPNPVGRALRSGESRLVAVLAANLDNPAMATIASSTEAALREAGYVMILCDTHDRADLQDEYLAAMRAQRVSGFVLIAAVASPGLAEIAEAGLPMVFVTRRNPVGAGPFVGIDDRAAGAAVADRFAAAGRRRPGVVFPRRGSSASRDRVAGFLERLAAHGYAPEVIRTGEGDGIAHLQVGYDGATKLLAHTALPDAVLCVSDQIAYGFARRAREQGLAVQESCEVVSIDGTPLNQWVAPWLVSVRIPYEVYGREVVERLEAIRAGEDPSQRLLPFSFG